MNTELEVNQLHEIDTKEPIVHESEVQSKKNPLLFIIPGVVILLLIVGFFVVRTFGSKGKEVKPVTEEAPIEETLKEVDSTVQVNLTKSPSKDNTVVISVSGLSSKYLSIGYELQYESGGVGKGVTSGSKPLDVADKETFERDIYLGTCSKNVCKPDLGVSKVDLVLEFTDKENKKSQFSKTFDL
jgi:hypothetical protein